MLMNPDTSKRLGNGFQRAGEQPLAPRYFLRLNVSFMPDLMVNSMTMELDLVPPAQLAQRCAEESSRRNPQQRDDRFCYELIRRAFGLEDEFALGFVFDIYMTVWSKFWIRDAQSFEAQMVTADDFKSITFQKVYRQLKGAPFNSFTSLNAVLAYLRKTLARTIAEYNRSLAARQPIARVRSADAEDQPDSEEIIPSAENVSEDAEKKLIWEKIEGRVYFLLPDEHDQVLFDCWAKQQLSRAEIVSEYGHMWPDENAVRVALQRIRRHLLKDVILRALLKDIQ